MRALYRLLAISVLSLPLVTTMPASAGDNQGNQNQNNQESNSQGGGAPETASVEKTAQAGEAHPKSE